LSLERNGLKIKRRPIGFLLGLKKIDLIIGKKLRRIGASPEIDSGVEVRNASLEVWPSAALKYFHGMNIQPTTVWTEIYSYIKG
jgi:hypothetical protein